jgi:peptide-methionine (R)-S-oxide reductase
MSTEEISGTRPDGVPYPVQLNNDELKKTLDPIAYAVLREAATERPHTGEYTDTETIGVYKCRACTAELFRSETKFHSGCGWPSFYAPVADDCVVLLEDTLLGYPRVEARCGQCGSHLGHVFRGEGFKVPTDERWCINSVCLTLEPR